jgi:Spy/CpxP family protein refolding chaperone
VKGDETVIRGQLPPNWGKLGLTEEQKQKIYQIQYKFNSEIARLEAQVKELRAKRDQEMRSVLTEEQKKRLEDILLKKIK